MGSSAGKNKNNSNQTVAIQKENAVDQINCQKNVILQKIQKIDVKESQWDDVQGEFIFPEKMELKQVCKETQQQVDEAIKRLVELKIISSKRNVQSTSNILQRNPQKQYSYIHNNVSPQKFNINSERVTRKQNQQQIEENILKPQQYFGPNQIVRRNNQKTFLARNSENQISPERYKENIPMYFKQSKQNIQHGRMSVNQSPQKYKIEDKMYLPPIKMNNQFVRSESSRNIRNT